MATISDVRLSRADGGYFGDIRNTIKRHASYSARTRRFECIQTVELGLAEKFERIGKIFKREPRLFDEALRCQIICITARGGLRHLYKPLLNTAIEIRVD